MSINFLNPSCSTKSDKNEFGLVDDTPPPHKPAYIDETNRPNWIATVKNPSQHSVTFYAIDHCVNILRVDGKMESKCDGVLLYHKNLIFVELKSKKSRQWFKKGREQLTSTIAHFKLNHDISLYAKVEAYVCNNLKPLAHTGQASNIQKFKNETGFILKGKSVIDII